MTQAGSFDSSPTQESSSSAPHGLMSPGQLSTLLTPRVSGFCPHQPTERQTAALVAHRFLPDDEPSEVFYGGAAGGGKSDWLLMGALEYVDVPGYAAILFRRTLTELALPGALLARAREWLEPQAGVHWNDDRKQWRFPSGATIQFAYMDSAGDELRYQSAEFQYVAFDELTQWPTSSQYEYLFSRIRRPATGPLAHVPLRMRAASNPGGPGHGWVRKRFPIDGRPRGGRVFVPAKIADNPHLDQDAYRKSLSRLDDTTRRRLEDGDWQAAEGLAFDSFDRRVHVVAPFDVPGEWRRVEFMDHGVANPAAWYVAASDLDGNLIVFGSYYQPGLISTHCDAIAALRNQWYPRYRVDGGYQRQEPGAVIADPSVRSRSGAMTRMGDPATTATEYLEQSDGKIRLVGGNNDRFAGRARILELLRCDPERPFPAWHPRSGEYGSPSLFLVDGACDELVTQLEDAPLLTGESGRRGAGEITDPKWESTHGHAVAALRYGALAWLSASDETEQPPDDPRARLLWEHERRLDQHTGRGLVHI